MMLATTSLSQTYPSFPGAKIDRRTLHAQERVEELFVSGNFDRAYFIYRNDLAPLGDKYAQYMVGYMNLTGKSVHEDHTIALAWFRLAAERGEPSILQARDKLQESLSPTQIATASSLFAELRAEISDQVLIYNLVQEDLELLRDRQVSAMTKSHVIVIHRRYGYISGDYYYRLIQNRLADRLSYLKHVVDVADVESAETKELAKIESEIKELIAEIDKR